MNFTRSRHREPRGADEAVVIPFDLARAGLWTAQQEWLQSCGSLQRQMTRIFGLVDRVECDLEAIAAAIDYPYGEHR